MGIDSTAADRKRIVRARAGRMIAVLIVGVLIVGSMYLYNYVTTSPRFAVEHVELLGLTRIDRAEVDRLVADLKGHNILLAPLDVYEARLEAHPRIASVTARRVLPDRVVYDVVEREPVALVFTDRYYEIAADGVVMAGDDYTAHLDLPTITGVASRDVKAGRVCTDPMVRGAHRGAGSVPEYRARFRGGYFRSAHERHGPLDPVAQGRLCIAGRQRATSRSGCASSSS